MLGPLRAPGDAERYSIAFLHDVNHHALDACPPTCRGPDNPAKYDAMPAGDQIYEMYRKAYVQGAAE